MLPLPPYIMYSTMPITTATPSAAAAAIHIHFDDDALFTLGADWRRMLRTLLRLLLPLLMLVPDDEPDDADPERIDPSLDTLDALDAG